MTTANKTFTEINAINVNKYVEKKDKLTYLSWSYAWAEIKKIDEKANYLIHENVEGNPFFASTFGIDVKVSVTVNEITHTMRLPVMDGANKAMKTEGYEYKTKYDTKTVKAADMFDINKAIMRCLVKAIAMHGLGLYIYAGEDLPETVIEPTIKEKLEILTNSLDSVDFTGTKIETSAKFAYAPVLNEGTNSIFDKGNSAILAKVKAWNASEGNGDRFNWYKNIGNYVLFSTNEPVMGLPLDKVSLKEFAELTGENVSSFNKETRLETSTPN